MTGHRDCKTTLIPKGCGWFFCTPRLLHCSDGDQNPTDQEGDSADRSVAPRAFTLVKAITYRLPENRTMPASRRPPPTGSREEALIRSISRPTNRSPKAWIM